MAGGLPLVGDPSELAKIAGREIPADVWSHAELWGSRIIVAREPPRETVRVTRDDGSVVELHKAGVKEDLTRGWILAVGDSAKPPGYLTRLDLIGAKVAFGRFAGTGLVYSEDSLEQLWTPFVIMDIADVWCVYGEQPSGGKVFAISKGVWTLL